MLQTLYSGARGIVFGIFTALLCGCVYTPFEFSSSKLSLDSLWSNDSQESKAEALDQARPRFFLPPPRAKVLPAIALELTDEVQHEMRYLNRTSLISSAVSRHPENVRIIREVLNDEGLPRDLMALALIESGLNPHAKSQAGAVGMWQLMKSTARLYDLSVNFFNDERKDPVLSTLAATRHLKDLYYIYKDWHLALAAYNAGSGKIDRAMMRTGATTYWQLVRSGALRRETERFVPRVIAAALLLRQRGVLAS